MTQGPTATKRSVLEQLLDQGMVLVALDARVEGVDVPTHLGGDPQLRLNLSYRFGLPMSVEGWGVRATLTFAGVPYTCRFPWAAIFLVVSHVSGQPYLFPDDIPAELLSEAPEMAATLAPTQSSSRPKLTLIRSGEAPPPSTTKRRPASKRSRDEAAAPPEPASPGGRSGSRRSTSAVRGAAVDDGSPAALRDAAAGRATKRRPNGKPAHAAGNDLGGAAKAGKKSPAEDAAADHSTNASTPRQRGHLRLVK